MTYDVTLIEFRKVLICPGTEDKVRVTLVRDDVPLHGDGRGPNRESKVRISWTRSGG